MGEPHTHYNRSVFESTLLHGREWEGKVRGCKNIRERIKAGIEAHLTEDWLQRNVSGSDGDYLHHHETCSCDMGKIGKANKLAANKRRSDFYKTERWREIRKRYKQRAEENRKELIDRFNKFMKSCGNVDNQADLERIKQHLARM